ncbi:MAG: PAS domain-containing protein [Dehalococcoidia bacterium]
MALRTSALLRLLDIHTPPRTGLGAYGFVAAAAAGALLVVVTLQWGTGHVLFAPALFAAVIVTWYVGLQYGLIAFLAVALTAPALSSLPIGASYSTSEYIVTVVVTTPLALLSAFLVHSGRQAMVSLRRSDQLFEAFMANLPGSAWMKDAHGRYVYANSESQRILRRTRDDLYTRTDAQVFPAALAARLHDPDALPLARREPVHRVEAFPDEDGEHEYLIVRFPILDDTGDPEFLGAIGLDITDRARAERQLTEQSAQLQLVIDQVPAFVAYVDSDQRFVTVNRQLADAWFSLPVTAVRGRRIADIETPETYARTGPHIERALGGEPVEFEMEVRAPAGGPLRWFEARFVPDIAPDGAVAGFSALTIDISERKHVESERALLARLTDLLNRTLNSEETAQALVSALVPGFVDGAAVYFARDGLLDGVMRAGPDDLARPVASYRVNAADTSGVAEVLRSGLPEFYRESPADLPLPSLVEEGGPRSTPASQHVSTMLVPLRVHDRVAAVLVAWTAESGRQCQQREFDLLRDVGRRAERAIEHSLLYEDSLRIAEELRVASQAKDEFLGTVSHELRTPITVVLGNASLLAARHQQMDAATISASLNDLLGQVERLHRVVENMLILTRLDTAQPETEPVLISRSISRVIAEAQRQQPGRVIRLESSDWDLFAIASESYLHQVILNYLHNAIRFSPPALPIDVTVRQYDHSVEVRVLDSGIGLDDEDLESLFTPFYRSTRVPEEIRGMGIGLSVSKRLVDVLGGRVWARRREEGGAEFGFSLPLAGDGEGGALDLAPLAVAAEPTDTEHAADAPASESTLP